MSGCITCGDPTKDLYHISRLDSLEYIPEDKREVWDEVCGLVKRLRGRGYGSQDDANRLVELFKLMYGIVFSGGVNPVKWSYLCLTNDYRRFVIEELKFYDDMFESEGIVIEDMDDGELKVIIEGDMEYVLYGRIWLKRSTRKKKGYKDLFSIEDMKVFLKGKEFELISIEKEINIGE